MNESRVALPPSKNEFDLKRDLLASIVVFLVALPLCIGIAVAVGVSPGRALITGIIGGIIVGAIGGCPLQVCGPAAGLFVIVADALFKQRTIYTTSINPSATEADAMQFALLALGVSVMFAGILQFTAGQLKLGQWFRAVSPAVIEGMLAGIGILIFASQFHVMFDHEPVIQGHKAQGGLQYLRTMPDAVWSCWKGSPLPSERPVAATHQEQRADTHGHAASKPVTIAPMTAAQHWHPALIGIVTISIIVLWNQFVPKRLQLIPGALVAILVAIGVVLLSGWQVRMLAVSGNILDDVSLPTFESLRLIVTSPAIGTALMTGGVIAIVASAETLLCATAVDQMHGGHPTQYDKELAAHGIGNFLCGLVGAMPMTGVIVRSSANVQAGATSRLSTILHGMWLLVFVVALPTLLAYIPKAALGAILVYTGYKLVKFNTLRELWKIDKGEALIFLATMTIIVAEDLLLGVLAGLALSALKLLHRFSYLRPSLTIEAGERRARLQLEGAATFIRLPILASFLNQVPGDAELHVDFTHLTYIDHACLELMTSWAKRHSSAGGRLIIDWESLHGRFRDDAATAFKRSAGVGQIPA